MATSQQQRDEWLDLARGLSALLVCAGHLRSALFADRGEDRTSLVGDGFYAITSLGHEAVMVFFVLSGYWVGGSVFRQSNRFSWRHYALARGSRLWVVLLPALGFTLLVDLAIDWLDPSLLQGAHHARLSSGPATACEYSRSLPTLLGNVLLLQNLLVPVFGSNGPLWSLAYEGAYYLAFPLLAIGLRGLAKPWQALLGLAISTALVSCIRSGFALGFLVWLMGAAAFVLHEKRLGPTSLQWRFVALLAFLAAIAHAKLSNPLGLASHWNDGCIGLSFAFWILTMGHETTGSKCGPLSGLALWLSSISYSLYLFHFPLVLLIFAGGYRQMALEFNAHSLLHFVFWLAVILALSHLAWWAFERRTSEVRAFLSRKLQSLGRVQP